MLNEIPTAKSELNEAYFKKINKAYKSQIDAVKSIKPDFTQDQATRLAVLLENINTHFNKSQGYRLNEGQGTQVGNVADGIKNQYFDIVTAVFPNLIAEELFSVQPLQSRVGQIFYLKYIYGDTKGRTRKGDTIFSALAETNQDGRYMADYSNRTYTSEYVDGEMAFTGEGSSKTDAYEFNLDYVPVRPNTVNIDASSETLDGVMTAVTYNDVVDPSNPGFGKMMKGTTEVGTIDYSTGRVSITDTVAEGSIGEAFYEYNLEYAPSTIPSIELKIDTAIITTRPRKLKGVYSLDAGYDLKMSQGIDIDDALLEAAAQELKNEVDAELIMTAYAQARHTISWNDNYDNQSALISKRDYYEDFIDCIVRGSTIILNTTKRVEANWLVVGKRGADVLSFIAAPRFIASGDTTSIGPRFLGTLDGKWKVYVNPFMPNDDFLLGYKGNTLIDAGLIYAPYLLFFATETIMLEDFLGRRGFATTYGKRMINPDLYVRGRITKVIAPGRNNPSVTENPNGTAGTIGGVIDIDPAVSGKIDEDGSWDKDKIGGVNGTGNPFVGH